MTNIGKFLRALLLSLYMEMPTRKETHLKSHSAIERVREEAGVTREERKKKQVEQRRKKANPFRHHKVIYRGGYKGTKSRDHRYSNQQKLRRMYRNS